MVIIPTIDQIRFCSPQRPNSSTRRFVTFHAVLCYPPGICQMRHFDSDAFFVSNSLWVTF